MKEYAAAGHHPFENGDTEAAMNDLLAWLDSHTS